MSSIARQSDHASERAIAPVATWWMATALLVGLLLVLFWDWFRTEYFAVVQYPSDWGHIAVIPFISAYLVYRRRDELAKTPIRAAYIGLVPLLLGVFIYMAAVFGPAKLHHHNIRGMGVTLALFGIVLTIGGWGVLRWTWFALLYLCIFGQYVSERFMVLVTYPMQDLAARGAHLILNLIQVETERSGNTLYVMQGGVPHALNIAEACSGMRMLVAFMALGVAIAYTGLPRLWQQVALVLLGIPVAIFVNILRVVTLGLLSLDNIEFASGQFHSLVGLVWLVPAFLIYMGILWILRNILIEDDGKAAS